jgi:hypothetical protein
MIILCIFIKNMSKYCGLIHYTSVNHLVHLNTHVVLMLVDTFTEFINNNKESLLI